LIGLNLLLMCHFFSYCLCFCLSSIIMYILSKKLILIHLYMCIICV